MGGGKLLIALALLLALAVPLWALGGTEEQGDEWVPIAGLMMAISTILTAAP